MPTAGRKCEKGEFGSFYLLFSAKSKSPQVCEIIGILTIGQAHRMHGDALHEGH